MLKTLVAAVLLLMTVPPAAADEVILAPEQFVREAFDGAPPPVDTLWLDDAMQAKLTPIFGHRYPSPRVRYWHARDRSVWILEDIGKEFPITAGFVVKGETIDAARVLIYRESRGGEVRYPGFLKQFSGETAADGQLTKPIDGISGATLSVEAMRRMARAALVLSQSLR